MNNKNKISKNGSYKELYGHFDFEKTYDYISNILVENDIFVEVGSAWGKSAVYMMERLHQQNKKIKFYCIDIFTQAEDIDGIIFPFGIGKEYRNKMRDQTLYYDFIYNTHNSFAKDFKPIPIRTYSDLGSNIFEEETCKAVFIDAAHDYDSVKKDLESWWPKICKGGILAGHDFYGKENGRNEENGVALAVKEFLKKNNLTIDELDGTTFLIKKY